jgi:hypothetical protein
MIGQNSAQNIATNSKQIIPSVGDSQTPKRDFLSVDREDHAHKSGHLKPKSKFNFNITIIAKSAKSIPRTDGSEPPDVPVKKKFEKEISSLVKNIKKNCNNP